MMIFWAYKFVYATCIWIWTPLNHSDISWNVLMRRWMWIPSLLLYSETSGTCSVHLNQTGSDMNRHHSSVKHGRSCLHDHNWYDVWCLYLQYWNLFCLEGTYYFLSSTTVSSDSTERLKGPQNTHYCEQTQSSSQLLVQLNSQFTE